MSNVDAVKRYRERHPERYKALRAAANKRWREKNREEHARRNREWYRANSEKIQDHVLRRKFGISKVEYDSTLSAQNGVCAVCSSPCKSGRRLAVDHCHATGKVRGLLCTLCNTALGSLRDDPEIARKLIKYMEK